MKLNSKILKGLKQTVNPQQFSQQPVIEEPNKQSQVKQEQPKQKEAPIPVQLQPQPKKNEIDYSYMKLPALFNLLKVDSEFKQDNVNEFIKALNKEINNWTLKYHLSSVLIELINFTKNQLNLQFVFKGKEYPFVLTLNPNKIDSQFSIYSKLKKQDSYKDLTDEKDTTEVIDSDKNFLANIYNQILKAIQ